jgi:uncharacterized protein YqeY
MTETNLKSRIQDDMKQAMRAQDKPRLNAIRLILAAVKQYEVDQRAEVDDIVLLGLLDKMSKQRRDSITQFEAAQRHDLAAQEHFELSIIQTYMPTPLSELELDQLIAEAIQTSGAQSIKEMGKAMGYLKPKVQGRADMAQVGNKLKQKLEQVGG